MLTADARLRSTSDFAETLRLGRRAGRRALVVTVLSETADPDAPPRLPRVGFVVGRRIGGAVVRNRLRRRLQHLMAERLPALPAGSRVVIRTLPGAERWTYNGLGRELDALLTKACR